MDGVTRYEITAEAFRIMTGHMAPGKDPAPATLPGQLRGTHPSMAHMDGGKRRGRASDAESHGTHGAGRMNTNTTFVALLIVFTVLTLVTNCAGNRRAAIVTCQDAGLHFHDVEGTTAYCVSEGRIVAIEMK